MSIREETVFVTEDDKKHENLQRAELHQKIIEVRRKIEFSLGTYDIEPEAIILWILENPEMIKGLIAARDAANN